MTDFADELPDEPRIIDAKKLAEVAAKTDALLVEYRDPVVVHTHLTTTCPPLFEPANLPPSARAA